MVTYLMEIKKNFLIWEKFNVEATNERDAIAKAKEIYENNPKWDINTITVVDKIIVDVELKDGESGYDAVEKYIQRYWDHNSVEPVVASIGISYDGNRFEYHKEIAYPENFRDIIFLYDWWEGQKFIKLLGIKAIEELDVAGGIYE